MLWSLGVSRAQGFLFGPALPGQRLTRLLARHGRRGAPGVKPDARAAVVNVGSADRVA